MLKEHGTRLDKIYFSPYYGEGIVEPFNVDDDSRKPGIGMFRQAKQEFDFDPAQSWMIGDRDSDIAFGKKAGLKCILLLTGHGWEAFSNEMKDWQYQPDFVVKDLLVAAKLIKSLLPVS